jgi:hypothetical protein
VGFEHRHERARHDDDVWLAGLAARHDVDVDDAEAILAEARRRAAEDPHRRSIGRWFALVLESQRSTGARLEVGKLARTDAFGRPRWRAERPELAPGRYTRTMRAISDETDGRSAPRRPPSLTDWLPATSPALVATPATIDPARPLFRDAVGPRPDRVPRWALDAIAATLQSSSATLPLDLRRMFEAELRTSLDHVRVFRVGESRAAAALRLLGARALTVGNDIVLGPDAAEAGTADGDHLLAHEVHHAAHPDGADGVSDTADATERAAQDFADRFTARARRNPEAAARAAVDAALAQAGVVVPAAHRDLLATYYGEGIALGAWILGADRDGQLLAGMLAHCEHHAACGHSPRRPPVASDEPTADESLDDATRARIEHTTGRPLGDVVVRRDAAVAARGRLGEAIGKVIRLAPDVPGPDTDEGRRVRLHEAAHVAQQDAPAAAGPTAAVEADAHAVADAAERGEARAPRVRADAGAAHGLSAGDVANAVGVDPMDLLRRFAPNLHSLLSGGFDGVVRQVGDKAATALKPVVDALDVTQLSRPILQWAAGLKKDALGFGALTGCCECFDDALAKALASVQGALASPAGQQLKAWISGAQGSANSWLTDKIKSVTDFVAGIIDTLLSGYETLREYAGPVIQEIWSRVADALGLDKSLSPAAAIKKKVQELWDELMKELEPLRKAIAEVWEFLCEETFIGDLVKFVQDCQKLVNAIQLCRQSRSRNPQTWLGILAREMKGTVFEGLITDLQSGYDTATAVVQSVERWIVRVLDKLGIIAAWNAAAPAIAAIGNAIKSFARSVQTALGDIKRIVHETLTAIAQAFRQIYEAVRPLLNFVVGFGYALAMLLGGNPLPMVMFVLGNLWLYALPDCYKEALCNFVLDIAISVFEWLPASFPLVVLIRSTALGFLRRLRAAPAAQKITGMDMLARLWAGDIEFAAGLFVGFFKGLWNSTPGMLVQLSLWSLTAPFEAMYAAYSTLTRMTGTGFASLAQNAEWLVDLMSRAQGVEADADGNVAQGPFAEPEGGDAPGGDSEETEVAAPEIGEPAPEEDEEPGSSSSPNPAGDGPAPGGEDENGNGNDELEDQVWDPLPPLPDLGQFVQVLEKWRNGMSREDITAMLGNFNLQLEDMGKQAGTRAAESFIAAMTARETPYRIGELVGTVVGFVTGEVLINLIPVGGQVATVASKIPQIAKLALQALKTFPTFVRALEALRAVLAPALKAFARFGDELAKLGKMILKWFDDLMVWAKGQLTKLMAWLERNFPKLRRLLRRLLRKALSDDLGEIADDAAEEAWERLESQLGDQVYTQGEIQQRLQGMRIRHPRDVQLQLRMVAHRSSWEIRATARKGAKSKSSDEGRGWVVTAFETRTPYYAPESDWWNHHRVLDRAADDLEDWRPPATARTFADRYQALRTAIEAEKTQGQGKLRMRGITFEFRLEDQASAERDHEATITLILTPNARTKRVMKSVHKASHLGATKDGDTFKGDFGHADWNWTGMDGGALIKHPVNSWGGYTHNVTTMPKPTGDYRHGGRTRGWDAEPWRRHIDGKVADKRKATPGLSLDDAQTKVREEENARAGTSIATWETLYLRKWQGHHIHEVSWAGDHDIANIIYVELTQHQHYSGWWDARAREIKDELGIAR